MKRKQNKWHTVTMLILAAVCLCLVGCSDFQAKGIAASSIDAQNAAAQAALTGPGFTAPEARVYVAANAPLMAGWLGTATENWFAYTNPFTTAGPQILVSPRYYGLLETSSSEFSQAAQLLPAAADADAILIAKKEALRFIKFEAAKGGLKSPPTPTSQPAQ